MSGYDPMLEDDDDSSAMPRRGAFRGHDSGSALTLDSFFEDSDSAMDALQSHNPNFSYLESREPHRRQFGDDGEEEERRHGVTFANQDKLPRLPIPNLEETANKLLQFLEALQTTQQKLRAQEEVLGFLRGEGPRLQKLLREYERNGISEGVLGSYIEEFWNESNIVSSSPDDAISTSSCNLNPFFLLDDSPDPEFSKHPIRRAASLTMATMKVASTIREEKYLPDTLKDQPLCMDQYKAVFGAARVPRIEGGDDIDVYPNATHIVVMCRNQMYYFQAMWPDTGVLAVDEEDIVDILTAIDRNSREMDKATAARNCPGVLTTLPRTQWAKIRINMFEKGDDRNAQYLTIVDSALFVLVLDDEIFPNSVEEAASNILHGTCNVDHLKYNSYNSAVDLASESPLLTFGTSRNRWYDKFQIIVCGDGTAGVNFEHSSIDSHTALRVVSDIYAETVVHFLQSITKTLPSHGIVENIVNADVERAGKSLDCNDSQAPTLDVLPKKISFEIPDSVQREIYHAGTNLSDEILAVDIKVLTFRDFGKKFIAANDMSPDSLVQMSLMLAYFKLYGKLVNVYEPVLTKGFFHGRTEAVRSATVLAKDLCEIYFDTESQPLSKLSVLKRAMKFHKRNVKECSDGLGVDRHLHALKCIAERYELPVPSFFDSDSWRLLNHSVILAANCGNPSLRLYGVSPAVPDGYGIGYIIKDYSIHFSVSSRRRQTSRFVSTLESIMRELGLLLQQNNLEGKLLSAGGRLNDIIEEIPEGTTTIPSTDADDTMKRGLDGDYSHSDYYEEIDWESSSEREKETKKVLTKDPQAPPRPPVRAKQSPPSIPKKGREENPKPASRWAMNERTKGGENMADDKLKAPLHMLSDEDLSGRDDIAQILQDIDQGSTFLTVPIHPMSDGDTSSRADQQPQQQPRRAPRRKLKKRTTSAGGNNGDTPPNFSALPPVPKRRGSMFSSMSARQALTTEQLNHTGAALEFNVDRSDRSDSYYLGSQYS